MEFQLPISAMYIALQQDQFKDLKYVDSRLDLNDYEARSEANLTVSTEIVSIDFVIEVARIIESSPQPYSRKFSISAYKRLLNKLKRLKKASITGKSGDFMYDKLDTLPETIKNWAKSLTDSVTTIFESEEYNTPMFLTTTRFGEFPVVLSHASYVKPRRDSYDPRPYVELEFSYYCLGHVEKIHKHLFAAQLSKKMTVMEIFEKIEFVYLSSEEYKEYAEQAEEAMKIYDQTGLALDCIGSMFTNRGEISPKLTKDKSLVIVDSEVSSRAKKGNVCKLLLGKTYGAETPAPVHPVISGYYLSGHSNFHAAYENFKPYEFKGIEFMDKLIIPDEHKEMIKMLIQFSNDDMEDLISGKSGGSFVLSKGAAGLGKTLTAEVVSEALGLPLYEIQCSQLGINVNDIENKFENILANSKRWNTILIINEADVYIRERGTDINHNAIVGVFLRLLEKSNGIMFMTTNLDNVDDAIESRANIVLNYKQPSTDDFIKIFTVLSENYELKLSSTFIADLVNYIDEEKIVLSGRDAKSMCKLLKMYGQYKRLDELTITDFKTLLVYKA